jgi:hypothetical protein
MAADAVARERGEELDNDANEVEAHCVGEPLREG